MTKKGHNKLKIIETFSVVRLFICVWSFFEELLYVPLHSKAHRDNHFLFLERKRGLKKQTRI